MYLRQEAVGICSHYLLFHLQRSVFYTDQICAMFSTGGGSLCGRNSPLAFFFYVPLFIACFEKTVCCVNILTKKMKMQSDKTWPPWASKKKKKKKTRYFTVGMVCGGAPSGGQSIAFFGSRKYLNGCIRHWPHNRHQLRGGRSSLFRKASASRTYASFTLYALWRVLAHIGRCRP
ncbi:unnamed protein product [Ixodes persulcatus]